MTFAANLPLWPALLIAIFLLLGAGLALIGSFGLYRLRNFYDRIHAPTLGTSWGTAGIVIASVVYFSIVESRFVLHPLLIGVFVIVTTPVTLILLSRAALYRDRTEKNLDVPPLHPLRNLPPASAPEQDLMVTHKNVDEEQK